MLKEIRALVLDFVYPSNIYCINCGRPIDKQLPYSLCASCVRSIRWANKITCESCGKPMPIQDKTGLCDECSDAPRAFEKGYTCAYYGITERALVHQLKYHDKDYYAACFAELMYDRICFEELDPDMVVPVPMYKEKEMRRGYNQAGLLAKSLSEYLNKPCYPHLLIRMFDTLPMSGLGAEQRRKNVQGVFTVAKWVQNKIYGKSILLVDDIFTTGSTTEACSIALKQAGAHKVYVVTFAAGIDIKKNRNKMVE